MDGEGRYCDNIFVERMLRVVKYGKSYLKAYTNATETRRELEQHFRSYNDMRPRLALDHRTPAELFHRERRDREQR